MGTRSFPASFAGMMAPFLIWAAHFAVVYAVNGLACAREVQDARLLGYPLVPAVVVAATAVALLLVVWVMTSALLGRGPAPEAREPPRRFMRWFTAASSGAALVATLWVGLPALQVPPCG